MRVKSSKKKISWDIYVPTFIKNYPKVEKKYILNENFSPDYIPFFPNYVI